MKDSEMIKHRLELEKAVTAAALAASQVPGHLAQFELGSGVKVQKITFEEFSKAYRREQCRVVTDPKTGAEEWKTVVGSTLLVAVRPKADNVVDFKNRQ